VAVSEFPGFVGPGKYKQQQYHYMKRLWVGAAVLAAAVPLLASASQFAGGEAYSLARSVTVSGNLYAAGGTVTVNGDVTGDLVVAGGTLLVPGSVEGDILAAGGNMSFLGKVAGDIRAAGGNIVVDSTISGDAAIAAGTVQLGSDTAVGGDAAFAGGQVVVDGDVAGDLRAVGGRITVNGHVKGSARLEGDEVVLGDHAVVDGDLTYRAKTKVDIAPTAVVGGTTTALPSAAPELPRASFGGLKALLGIWWITKLFMLLALALVGYWFFRSRLPAAARETLAHPGRMMLYGFIGIVCIPVAAIVLFVTIVGVPLGILLLTSYGALLVAGTAYAAQLAGSILMKVIRRKPTYDVTAGSVVLGAIAYEVIKLVPILGWLAAAIVCLMAFGTLLQAVYQTVLRDRTA
jgi:cytoskeletal protein CcmA (bactofilin family)